MGILSNVTKLLNNDKVTNKAPQFVISNFSSNNPFQNLIKDEGNYYEQYILYTFRAIDYISNKVASSKLELWNTNRDEIVNKNDPLWADLKSFNPYMNLWEARKLKEMHLLLTGAAYWYIDRSSRQLEFYPLDPTQMQIQTDRYGLPSKFIYQDGDGKQIPIDTNDIIYFRRINPKNWFEGISQVKQLNFWLSAYIQGTQYNMAKLANNINVDKFIVLPDISQDEKERVELQLRSKYGGVKNAGKTGVLDREPKIIDVQSNAKELDFVNGMKMLREDILAGFGIPEALIFPSATNSNTKEARIAFQADTLEPLLEQEKAVLNEQYLTKYNAKPNNKYYEFRFEEVVDADVNALFDQAVKFVNAGIFTRNDALKHVKMEPIANGDVYLTPQSQPVIPAGNKELKEKMSKLEYELNNMVELQEKQLNMQKYLKLADEQEGIVYQTAEAFFKEQFKRIYNNLKKDKSVNLKNIFNFKDEVLATEQAFGIVFENILSNSNLTGNNEIKEKLFKNKSVAITDWRMKAVSANTINEIKQRVNYFANVLNETTRNELTDLVIKGIENNFDTATFANAIKDLFNKYIDGQKNINILTEKGFYIAPININNETQAVSYPTENRYKQMYNNILIAENNNQITSVEANDALLALRGMLNNAEPIGKEINTLLNIRGINKAKDVSTSRSVTIARTESTFVRNLSFNDLYDANPFIKGKEWVSATDQSTRDSHLAVNGTVVKTNEAFQLEGGQLRFPGDTSLGAGAEEIVNCRCRIISRVI